MLDKKNQIADPIVSDKLNHITSSDEFFLYWVKSTGRRLPPPSST
jgi:hypothetical protein